MEDNLGINIFKLVVRNPSDSNFRLACWLSGVELPSTNLHQFWIRVEMSNYQKCSLLWREAGRILIINHTFIMLGLSIFTAWNILEAEGYMKSIERDRPINLERVTRIMNTPEAIPQELQEIMNELHAKLEIAGEGLDLFHALKKVHKHIHENPENLLFLKDEQVAEIVRACEITQDLTIKTTTKKAPKAKTSNDLILADNSLDFGDTSGMSLKELMASKKK